MNPYYNQNLSKSSYSNFLEGAQNVGKSVWQDPKMWAKNPYVAAGGLGVDMISRPLQDTAEQRSRMDAVAGTRLPDEQLDEYGNAVYNLGGLESGLDEAQEDLSSYYDVGDAKSSGDLNALDAINPLNMVKNYAHVGRTLATSDLGRSIVPKNLNFIAKKADKEQGIIDTQRQRLTDRKDDITQHNITATTQRNRGFQSGMDRSRRLNNINRLNIY